MNIHDPKSYFTVSIFLGEAQRSKPPDLATGGAISQPPFRWIPYFCSLACNVGRGIPMSLAASD